MSVKMFVSSIRIDGGTQPRTSINEQVVAEYAEALKAGAKFPPVTVFHDGADYWLGDGFHRYHGHRQAGLESIAADVRDGTRRDAVLFSVGANDTHGLRRSTEDKRKAVLTLLQDAEWGQWSDREIARRCVVSHDFVSKQRASLDAASSEKPAERTFVTKHGTTATMNTAGVSESNKRRAREMPKVQADPAPQPDESAELKAMLAEQSTQFEATLNENIALQKVVDADDKLAEAVAQVKQLTAENQKLRERITGLTNECAEAKKLAKYWRAQAQKQAA